MIGGGLRLRLKVRSAKRDERGREPARETRARRLSCIMQFLSPTRATTKGLPFQSAQHWRARLSAASGRFSMTGPERSQGVAAASDITILARFTQVMEFTFPKKGNCSGRGLS